MANISYGFASSHREHDVASNKYLQINNCGLLGTKTPTPIHYRTPRKDFMLVYFTDVGGFFKHNGTVFDVAAGDLVYIEAGTPICFGYKALSTHYWLHFSGKDIREIMEYSGMTQTGIYHIGTSSKITSLFSKICFKLSSSPSYSDELYCNGIFLQLLSEFADKIVQSVSEPHIIYSKIQPAIEHMHLFYYETHPLSFYANLCDLSLSSFKQFFTQKTHISPLAYLTSVRLENAKRLFSETNMSVSEVSFAVGYNDPRYFSRVFKKSMMITPKEYSERKGKSRL